MAAARVRVRGARRAGGDGDRGGPARHSRRPLRAARSGGDRRRQRPRGAARARGADAVPGVPRRAEGVAEQIEGARDRRAQRRRRVRLDGRPPRSATGSGGRHNAYFAVRALRPGYARADHRRVRAGVGARGLHHRERGRREPAAASPPRWSAMSPTATSTGSARSHGVRVRAGRAGGASWSGMVARAHRRGRHLHGRARRRIGKRDSCSSSRGRTWWPRCAR